MDYSNPYYDPFSGIPYMSSINPSISPREYGEYLLRSGRNKYNNRKRKQRKAQ